MCYVSLQGVCDYLFHVVIVDTEMLPWNILVTNKC
jgi:hypothetical protein